VFANRVLIRIFGSKRDEVKGKWRKLHNVELHKLYSYQNIIRQIKSRRKGGRGIWHAWERREKCTGFWWKSLKERDHLEVESVEGRMRSEWILEILARRCGVDSVG
jgi:PAS domain-containing protein